MNGKLLGSLVLLSGCLVLTAANKNVRISADEFKKAEDAAISQLMGTHLFSVRYDFLLLDDFRKI